MLLAEEQDEADQTCLEVLRTLTGAHAVTAVVDRLTGAGLSETAARAAIYRQVHRGLLAHVSLENVKQDAFGYYNWVDGHKLYGHSPEQDVGVSLPMLQGQNQEGLEDQWADNLLRPGDVCIDVGACLGRFTLRAARAVGPSGRVLAFEPELRNYFVLQKNIVANNYGNIQAVLTAIGSKTGTTPLYLGMQNRGDHRGYAPAGEERETVLVPCITLDDFVPRDLPTALIKLDTQGAELGILAGASNLIRSRPRLALLTEFWPTGLAGMGHTVDEFAAMLNSLGFTRIYSIEEVSRQLVDVAGRLASLVDPDTDHFKNLLCFK